MISPLNLLVMKTKGQQLLVQVLLMIVITAIVAFTCMNLAELVDMFSNAAGRVLTSFTFGF